MQSNVVCRNSHAPVKVTNKVNAEQQTLIRVKFKHTGPLKPRIYVKMMP